VWSGACCGRLVGFPLSGIAVFLFVSPAVVGGEGGALPSPGGARVSRGVGRPGGGFPAPLLVFSVGSLLPIPWFCTGFAAFFVGSPRDAFFFPVFVALFEGEWGRGASVCRVLLCFSVFWWWVLFYGVCCIG